MNEENKNNLEEVQQEVPQTVEPVQQEVPQTAEPVQQEVPQTVEPVQQEVSQTEKKGNKALIGLLCLVVIGVIAIISVLLLQPKKKNNDAEKEEKNVVVNQPKNDYRMLGNSLEKFDLYFLKLENNGKNKVYSPLSIKYALEMLAEGASGESKAQLDAVIGDYKAKKYDNNDNMSFGNAMFIRDTFKDAVKEEYQNMLKDKYSAEVITDSFESPDVINNWISNKTFKLIDKLVDRVSDKDFVLVNALAIDMKWVNQIHCASGSVNNVPCFNNGIYDVKYAHEKIQGEDYEYSRLSYPYSFEDEFTSLNFNGKENIKAAKILASFNKYDIVKTLGEDKIKEEVKNAYNEWLKTEEAKYYSKEDPEQVANRFVEDLKENYGKAANSTDFMLYDDDNVKAFAKDLQTYNGTTLQYVGIMPKNDSLNNYIDNVSVEDINNVINNLKDMKIENFEEGYVTLIEGDIPMFKFEYELSLMDDLKKLGITDIFDKEKADLGAMLKESKGVSITEAKHKANIEFSNEGIKAAAASNEGGAGNTGGGFNYLFEVPVKRIDLTFDNPYLYLIRDKDSGEVWFIGTVYEPITK